MMVTTDADRQPGAPAGTKPQICMERGNNSCAATAPRKIIGAMRKGNMPEVKEENDMVEDLFEIVG